MNLLTLVMFCALMVLAIYMAQVRRQNFEATLRQEVEIRGGTVLSVGRPFLRNGPWLFRGKGRIIMKVIYRDAAGELQQLWGRSRAFGNYDLDWEYSDGEFDG